MKQKVKVGYHTNNPYYVYTATDEKVFFSKEDIDYLKSIRNPDEIEIEMEENYKLTTPSGEKQVIYKPRIVNGCVVVVRESEIKQDAPAVDDVMSAEQWLIKNKGFTITKLDNGLIVYNEQDILAYAEYYHAQKSKGAWSDELKAELIQLCSYKESGREGCTYGDTDYDSMSVVYGYNMALEHLEDKIVKLFTSKHPQP